jgi:quercetin dioxygenase-like cupin family protein
MSIDLKHIDPAFTDQRGDITDVMNGDLHYVGVITFTEGAIRGNHYHKQQIQYTYMLTGEVAFFQKDMSKPDAPIEHVVMKPGDFVSIPVNVAHAYKALSKSASMMCLTTHTREGSAEYEEDTFRIDSIVS